MRKSCAQAVQTVVTRCVQLARVLHNTAAAATGLGKNQVFMSSLSVTSEQAYTQDFSANSSVGVRLIHAFHTLNKNSN